MLVGLAFRGTRLMPTIGAALAFHAPLCPAVAQSNGASQEIRIQATVPVFCTLRATGARLVISGRTDKGEPVALAVGSPGGMNVECNTPYAMSLDRITTLYSRNLRGGVASATGPANGNVAASVAQELPQSDDRSFTVQVALASRFATPGSAAVEQQCAFAGGDDDAGCDVIGSAGDVTLAPPRGRAQFALVTLGDLDERTISDTVDLDEIASAGSPVILPGKLLGPMKPALDKPAREITTASLRTTAVSPDEAARRAAVRRAKVISESLRLSVSGRF